ncbi:Wzz/FepE/Etk N-terminal domain-containing protein [Hydrogenovibrio sp. JE_KL2]|uniref:Wzz/FepE/Etk N-terminal domain-containing protein n=1 Tax=Hydrogenovibrio sp. JE_KL2 TaxID=2651188 RepID=UPI00128C41CF|nr:Wzz/FepE/Etk N-terminal domain-containing protein [Hydrogenovibrio sp. JE_KL2]MPQ75475.1 hypothetical protein [Hydrogenovibrio sp. JE_KL2]
MSDTQQRIKEQAYAAAYQDDEIDLFELWNGLVEEKKTIFVSFLSGLILAVGYIFMKSDEPILYQASATLQVQQIQMSTIKNLTSSSSVPYMPVESSQATVLLLSNLIPAEMKSASNFISISSTGEDKVKIQKNVEESIKIIEDRYREIFSRLKPLGYVEILPTTVIGGIKVLAQPVKPKKTLILAVAGVLGLILGVMIALVRKAYRNRQEQMETSVS